MENFTVRITNSDRICRICLKEQGTMCSLKKINDKYKITIAELLEICFLVEVDMGNNLPSSICCDCVRQTVEMYEFKLKFDQSEELLQQYLINNTEHKIDQEIVILEIENDSETVVEHVVKEMLPLEVESNEDLLTFKKTGGVQMIMECSPEEMSHIPSKTDISDEENNLDYTNTTKKGTKMYICTKCKTIFNTKLELTEHEKESPCGSKKLIPCPRCNLVLRSENYRKHVLKHSKICTICSKTFLNRFNLKRHHYHVHGIWKFSDYDEFKLQEIGGPGKCSDQSAYPEYVNHNSDNLEKYKRKLSCETCAKSFTLLSSLETHQLLHTDQGVVCGICGGVYPTEKKLKEHKLYVHDKVRTKREKRFLCNVCAKQFTTKAVLKTHMYTHLDFPKTHQCNVCNKRFSLSTSLAGHMKTHTGEKPYICHICSRAFNRPYNLRRHIYSHNNYRPYKCPICKKGFTVKGYVAVHMRSHTGEKPFECKVCGKSFVEHSALNKHCNKLHKDQ